MAADILFELQTILSNGDFGTVKSFIVLYNQFKPEEAGQTRVCFEFFVENLQDRYKRKFRDCHEVLSINPYDMEQLLMYPNPIQLQRSPESEKRRNKGKLRRDSGDNDNRAMCDWYAEENHNEELAEAAKISDKRQRNAFIEKEQSRHKEYFAGQNSGSPVRQIETE